MENRLQTAIHIDFTNEFTKYHLLRKLKKKKEREGERDLSNERQRENTRWILRRWKKVHASFHH